MIKRHYSIFFVLLILLTSCSKKEHYLFSYFTGNGEDGLHLAASPDGYHWDALNQGRSILAPKIGKGQLMRDPDITQGPDGVFHMVWTCGWYEKGIGYASSKDLVNWSKQQYIPVMEHEPMAKNCWAPEITYDPYNENYIIYWSTTIPGRFPATESSSEDSNNHRIYYVTTKDFNIFSEAALLYEPGFNVIDASIYPNDKGWFMLLKDETLDPVEKNLKVAFSKEPTGPFSAPSDPITGDYWAEGPTALRIDGKWVVYFDKYRQGAFGAVQSNDLKHWKDISDQVTFPEGIRHGTAFSVDKNTYKKLFMLLNEK